MKLLIIDMGMGNIHSVVKAVAHCGASPLLLSKPQEISEPYKIILPGVGAFSDAAKNLKQSGWWDFLSTEVPRQKIPLLGICLGMQLLADVSYEGKETKGLGLIPGEVKKLKFDTDYPVPHIGWNEVVFQEHHPIFNDIPSSKDFYFVHSYHFEAKQNTSCFAKTEYGNEFCSVVTRELITGVQFHPEKSGLYGLKLLKNFILC
ncbi:imidazole glycerol phosphate synthase subunit HisH [Candidiatus Paracoxiella cheracis]|uniref:imidazole glycerol phosphate synthase subunit HisH n=1 Tax=Candidiatus Paracoxiella cheracis TaxID=3405120 RepID=UPI003BF5EBF1